MTKQLFLTVSLLLSSGLSLNATNIVLNGDFETTNIGVNLFQPLAAGSLLLTNWTITAPVSTQGIDIISTRTGNLALANTGFQAIDMAGTPGRASIFQDLTTVIGQLYRITFAGSSNGGPITGGVTVLWGASSVSTINTPAIGTWNSYSFDVVASAVTTRLTFQGNIDGTNGSFLDSVQVNDVVVPEPNLGFLAGSALMAVGLLRFRKSSN